MATVTVPGANGVVDLVPTFGRSSFTDEQFESRLNEHYKGIDAFQGAIPYKRHGMRNLGAAIEIWRLSQIARTKHGKYKFREIRDSSGVTLSEHLHRIIEEKHHRFEDKNEFARMLHEAFPDPLRKACFENFNDFLDCFPGKGYLRYNQRQGHCGGCRVNSIPKYDWSIAGNADEDHIQGRALIRLQALRTAAKLVHPFSGEEFALQFEEHFDVRTIPAEMGYDSSAPEKFLENFREFTRDGEGEYTFHENYDGTESWQEGETGSEVGRSARKRGHSEELEGNAKKSRGNCSESEESDSEEIEELESAMASLAPTAEETTEDDDYVEIIWSSRDWRSMMKREAQ